MSKIINLFPVTNDDKLLGNKIESVEISNDKISKIDINYSGENIPFLDNIKEQNEVLSSKNKPITEFTNDYEFYLRKGLNKPSVLAVKKQDNIYTKQAFTLGGVSLGSVKDEIVTKSDVSLTTELVTNTDNSKDSNLKADKTLVLRKSLNKTITIDSNNITYTENKIDFNPIKSSDIVKQNIIENPNIGVLDLETYLHTKLGYSVVYAGGLYCKTISKPYIAYINQETLSSDDVVLSLLEEMFTSKYKGIIWYCHNFGNYDAPFILKTIINFNKSKTGKENPYLLEPVFKDNSLLKIKVGKVIGKSKVYINIVDSYSILPNSLKNLGKNFNVDIEKGIFPYKFVNENKLFYVGNAPDVSYYSKNSISHIEDYEFTNFSNWSVREETIKYLEKDLICLYDVLTEANNKFHLYFDVDITKGLTISKIAYEIYFSKYYKNNIPLINNKSIYNDIKQSYYGGITEVYKPYGENLYYYDVNSL